MTTMITRFTVLGDTHDELVTAARTVWRDITGELDADLPEQTFITVYSVDDTFTATQREPVHRNWQADVVVNEYGYAGGY